MPPDSMPVRPDDDDATRPAGFPRPRLALDDDRTVISRGGVGRQRHGVAPPTQPPLASRTLGIDDGATTWTPDDGHAGGNAGVEPVRSPVSVHGLSRPPQLARFINGVVVGSGRTTTVFKAHDPARGTDVAIKLLNPMLAQDEGCRAGFLRAARAAWGLADPHVAAIQEVGEFEGRPYIAMELIDGESLAEHLKQGPQLPLREAVRIGAEIASALAAAHSHGLMHGELCASAVLLQSPRDTVKITDFGIAAVGEGCSSYTRVGGCEEMLPSIAPDQARGEPMEARTDIFAAGTLLYHMLAGQPPFAGPSQAEVLRAIVQSPPTPLARLRPDAPAALLQVVDRCIAKAPEERYTSAAELAQALEQVGAELDAPEPAPLPQAIASVTPPASATAAIAPLRWALLVTAVVMTVSAMFGVVIARMQSDAAATLAVDQGALVARFFARQMAGAALAEEWEVVEVAIQELAKTGDIERIVVFDLDGVVRATTELQLLGHPGKPEAGELVAHRPGPVSVVRYASPTGPALAFETPLLYQDKTVARVRFGVAESVLTRRQGTAGWLVGWALAVSFAAGITAYALARHGRALAAG